MRGKIIGDATIEARPPAVTRQHDRKREHGRRFRSHGVKRQGAHVIARRSAGFLGTAGAGRHAHHHRVRDGSDAPDHFVTALIAVDQDGFFVDAFVDADGAAAAANAPVVASTVACIVFVSPLGL